MVCGRSSTDRLRLLNSGSDDPTVYTCAEPAKLKVLSVDLTLVRAEYIRTAGMTCALSCRTERATLMADDLSICGRRFPMSLRVGRGSRGGAPSTDRFWG
jgi:hypothetical protein